MDLSTWQTYVTSLDHELRFVTVSGAHLYGFPSPDSDVDLRGGHQLPLRDVVGLDLPNQTIEIEGEFRGGMLLALGPRHQLRDRSSTASDTAFGR